MNKMNKGPCDTATCETQATWTIPADRSIQGRPHNVPISARAIEILREAQSLMTARAWSSQASVARRSRT